jgi:hypothetical protein
MFKYPEDMAACDRFRAVYDSVAEGPVYQYQGRNASISKLLIEDQKISITEPFWLQGILYRPVGWDTAKEWLRCRILDPIT